jgi:hypothetical protein
MDFTSTIKQGEYCLLFSQYWYLPKAVVRQRTWYGSANGKTT